MLKHALSAGAVGVGTGTGTVRHYPNGGGGGRNAYRSPPPPLDHSYHGGTGLRSFTPANPYSNLSALSNSKRSGGGSPPHPHPHPHPRLANGGPRHPLPPGFVEIKLGSGQGQTQLNHSNHSHQRTLDASALSASKHSLGGNSSSVSPPLANGGLGLSGAGRLPGSPLPPPPPRLVTRVRRPGVREMLTSLGLLCLVSLLLALLSLVFMLKISPVTAADVKELIRSDQVTVISPEEYVLVYEVTLALCALSLSLNLCCLLVCAVQFLFAVKLVRDSPDGERTNKYLKKSAFTRVCAVGGFFVSIPVFLTGIILYTFIQFHSTPAVVTSILIGLGIMFCGCAMVHNVFVWQKEKTNAVRALAQQHRLAIQREQSLAEQSRSIGLPICLPVNGSISPGPIHSNTHFDLNNETPTPPEICTLV